MSPPWDNGLAVWLREPKAFDPEATCVVGLIRETVLVDGTWLYSLDAEVGKMGGGYKATVTATHAEIAPRLGTPLSELSGRPGHAGYGRFRDIATSWGFD